MSTFGGSGWVKVGDGWIRAARTRGSDGGTGRRGTGRMVVFRGVEGRESRCQWRIRVTSIEAADRSSRERFWMSRVKGSGVGFAWWRTKGKRLR